MKKVVFIVMLILFMVIDTYTLYLVSPDLLFPHKSIYVTNQDDDIAEKVKAYFSIQYEISKIVYRQGFPDGYYLDVYDVGGEKHEEFDDTFNVPGSDTIPTLTVYIVKKPCKSLKSSGLQSFSLCYQMCVQIFIL